MRTLNSKSAAATVLVLCAALAAVSAEPPVSIPHAGPAQAKRSIEAMDVITMRERF